MGSEGGCGSSRVSCGACLSFSSPQANPHTPPIKDFWDMIHTTPEFIEKSIIYPKQDLVNL
ncbi:type III secretion apparatus SpaO [uncultured Mobiluncus sp.]|uniref:type III secretion apparatus SpaO n=1 Tax=uncultured Mobiluncus sp. TaxID=293425 RepID=UPI0025D94528|nr:type III secretion apparatus SpaO [uncultured Mobiluncus sp.]